MTMATPHPPPGTIIYPEEDGSVTESDVHFYQGAALVLALKLFFADQPDVFVAGNIAFYYQEGNPRKYFGPDVLVARGVRPGVQRPSYLLWQEGVPPAVIIELTSASTRQEDVLRKPRHYAALGVREYYLFDPLGEYLTPRLQGYHLNAEGRYERLSGEEFDSPAMGLRLLVRDGALRLLNPVTGLLLPTLDEADAALAEKEQALTEAEAEIARLRAELARRQ
jgi:Uma2 family endonuclease